MNNWEIFLDYVWYSKHKAETATSGKQRKWKSPITSFGNYLSTRKWARQISARKLVLHQIQWRAYGGMKKSLFQSFVRYAALWKPISVTSWSSCPTKNNSIIAKPLVLCYNKNAPRGARPSRYLQPQSHRSMYPGPCITLLKWIIRFSQAIFQAKWYQTMIPIWYPELWELWEHREKHEFTSQNSLQTTITEEEKEPREGTPKRVGMTHGIRKSLDL